jgi:hypothetical protein
MSISLIGHTCFNEKHQIINDIKIKDIPSSYIAFFEAIKSFLSFHDLCLLMTICKPLRTIIVNQFIFNYTDEELCLDAIQHGCHLCYQNLNFLVHDKNKEFIEICKTGSILSYHIFRQRHDPANLTYDCIKTAIQILVKNNVNAFLFLEIITSKHAITDKETLSLLMTKCNKNILDNILVKIDMNKDYYKILLSKLCTYHKIDKIKQFGNYLSNDKELVNLLFKTTLYEPIKDFFFNVLVKTYNDIYNDIVTWFIDHPQYHNDILIINRLYQNCCQSSSQITIDYQLLLIPFFYKYGLTTNLLALTTTRELNILSFDLATCKRDHLYVNHLSYEDKLSLINKYQDNYDKIRILIHHLKLADIKEVMINNDYHMIKQIDDNDVEQYHYYQITLPNNPVDILFYLETGLMTYQQFVEKTLMMAKTAYFQCYDKSMFDDYTELILYIIKHHDFDQIQNNIVLYFLKFYCNNQYIVKGLLKHPFFKTFNKNSLLWY